MPVPAAVFALDSTSEWERLALAESADVLAVADAQGILRFVAPSVERALGWSAAELTGRPFHDLVHEGDRPLSASLFRSLQERPAGVVARQELRLKRKDQAWPPFECAVRAAADGVILNLRDVSGRESLGAGVAEMRRQLRGILDGIPDSVILTDAQERVVLYNSAFQAFYPEMRDLVRIGARFEDLVRVAMERGAVPEAAGRIEQVLAERLAMHRRADGTRFVRRLRDGRYLQIYDMRTPDGGIIGVATDVTELVRQREALRASESQFRTVTEHLPALVTYVDRDRRLRFANRTAELWYDAARHGSIVGKHLAEVIPPERLARSMEGFDLALSGTPVRKELESVYPDGRRRFVDRSYIPDVADDGSVRGCFVVSFDLTDRRAVEDQLRQAQKMEAVGRLTGGVAHDFNNLLGIIVGNLDLLAARLPAGSDLQRLAERATAAAERGAGLTQRLLAFSRQQALRPHPTDVGALIGEMTALLRRTLGENVTVDTELGSGLWPAMVDPGQLESALLNLAINARDAMPGGGRVCVSATNLAAGEARELVPDLSAGDYIAVAVSDSGEGMSPDVASRAFEPFFTTKEVGKGSGLGLSMVYGFARQSGGHVRLDSAPTGGTCVTILLPRAAPAAAPATSAGADPLANGAGALVLVVEDNPDLREFSVAALDALGFRTVEAADARTALDLLERTPGVSVLLSDIVLPGGIDGFELARRALARHPALKVLFASGFTDKGFGPQEGLAGVEVLRKPFRISELSKRLSDLLDRPVG